MAELSRESGVAVPTVKFYLREGLLAPGERTGPNQARYGEAHVRRLRLIRALIEIGGMSIATVRDVLAEVDEPDSSLHHVLGVVQRGLVAPSAPRPAAEREWALARIGEVVGERGWRMDPDGPIVDLLVGTLCTLRELGNTAVVDRLGDYADAAAGVAETDLATLDASAAPESVVESAVVSMVVSETMFNALRLLAQKQASARRFPG